MPTPFNPAEDASADNRHRPPYRASYHTTAEPLIVTPTFLTRADATPQAERPLDEGATRSRHGNSLENPDAEPAEIALEANPNLAFEHWDEYWRKVHGPKFAYEEPGSTSEPVLRYDQVHRISAGPSSYFRPPYHAMTEADHKLVADPHAQVPTYQRPRWDGFAYIAYASEADINRVLKQPQYDKRVVADEQTAFRMVTRSITREYILLPSATHRDPICLVKIHYRQPTLSREAFQERLLHQHAEVVLGQAATHTYVRRYAQLHNIGSTQPDPEGSLMDAISVLSFASMNDVEDFLVTAGYGAIEADEASFMDLGRSEFWTGLTYSVINRLLPELPTRY
ncbi:EthD domain-containing protein [Hymenobacter tibetensis]|uniref:EthD domain-containing protein n=1 Tax=Hymenobacter tibetensis TaxID=497967 RepID=A0ABY4CT45_9BACT|nr:EthD domain-containing protein [Hymenobacter tibetensis]UOG73217.1 EthD domain-containing protein [Hymenobacter tibetensis]